RKVLEAIWSSPAVQKSGSDWEAFKTYSGRVWFSNGIYHHYANDKFQPGFSYDYFAQLVKAVPAEKLPLQGGQTVDELLTTLKKVLFDPDYMPKMVNLKEGIDHVAESANNFYEGVTQEE